MKSLVRRLINMIAGPFEVWSIWEKSINHECTTRVAAVVPMNALALENSKQPEIKSLAYYDGPQALGFGIAERDDILCACWYWYGERYAKNRGFWPLKEQDAKLVQITTAVHARGRKLAPCLIVATEIEMAKRGFRRLYARIWYGHVASENAFRAAGWRRIAWVATYNLFFRKTPSRLQWKTR